MLSRLLRDRGSLPPRDDLPWWLSPVPTTLENLGFRLVWLVVAINIAGTAFGFWYYRAQFAATPAEMWLLSPTARWQRCLSPARSRCGLSADPTIR